ncbi:MAG: NAD-dependent epimerase/dehydratase family protein, partial [Deltaproteobacteria bacterium]|nr:NAD-dependent epimerase/dehydratase family protein [Deltaproteobacteria bacterium]
MKTLVLGATGFIGSHVARELVAQEIDVRILRRGSSPTRALEGLKVEPVLGDLNDPESLKKSMKDCKALFHVAGYYPLYSLDRERQKKIALQQMKNVLEAASNASIEKIIYTSSMSTMGKTVGVQNFEPLPSHEDTPYDPKDFTGLYYQIKYLQEQAAQQAVQSGSPIVIINPTGVFGDYDVKPTSGALVVEIAKGRLPALFDAKMNAVDVRDVAKAQVTALKKGKVGRRYLIGGCNTTVWELAHWIARLAKVPPPRLKLPLLLGEGAACASEWMGKLLHQEKPLIP